MVDEIAAGRLLLFGKIESFLTGSQPHVRAFSKGIQFRLGPSISYSMRSEHIRWSVAGVLVSAIVVLGAGLLSSSEELRSEKRGSSVEEGKLGVSRVRVETLERELQQADSRIGVLQQENADLRRQVLLVKETVPGVGGRVSAKAELESGVETPFSKSVKVLLGRAVSLNNQLDRRPGSEIPELKYLKEGEWLNVAGDADFGTEEGVRKALAELRSKAKNTFAPLAAQAMQRFMEANGGQPPTSPLQLKPFFLEPVEDSVLSRYEMATNQQGLGSQTVLSEVTPLDPDYDTHVNIGPWGSASMPAKPFTP